MTKQLMRSGGVLSEAAQTFLLQAEIKGDGCVSGMLQWMSHEKALYYVRIDQAILMMNAWLEEEDPGTEGLALRIYLAGRKMRPAICDAVRQRHAGAGAAAASCGRKLSLSSQAV